MGGYPASLAGCLTGVGSLPGSRERPAFSWRIAMAESKGTRGIVYFCPELRLYRYAYKTYEKVGGVTDEENIGDEADFKFDGDELEDMVDALVSTGDDLKEAEAKFVAHITGLARLHPHKIVKFDTGIDKIDVEEPDKFWEAHDKERERLEAEAERGAGGKG